jgi:hypothetical protein
MFSVRYELQFCVQLYECQLQMVYLSREYTGCVFKYNVKMKSIIYFVERNYLMFINLNNGY